MTGLLILGIIPANRAPGVSTVALEIGDSSA